MVAVGGVIEHAQTGKILLVRRADSQDWHPGEWEISYGRIDQHEDPTDGLKREIGEETGIKDLQIGNVISVWHMYRGEKNAHNDLIDITFHCQTETAEITLSDEHSEYKWVEPKEALELVKIEGIRRDVLHHLELSKKNQ